MQEYFERLGNEPARWGKPTAALLGGLEAQIGYKVPSIGGKDSMSGSFNDLDVPPVSYTHLSLASSIASLAFSGSYKSLSQGKPFA